MELNLTIPHLLGFLMIVYVASHFTSGTRLWRVMGWVWLWQLLTPARPAWPDIPLMVVGFVATEWIYFMTFKAANKRSA